MQYKLKHKTLAKIRNRNIMKIGKRFRKKRWRKRLMKERTMYILCLSVVVEYSTHSEPHRPALRATHSII